MAINSSDCSYNQHCFDKKYSCFNGLLAKNRAPIAALLMAKRGACLVLVLEVALVLHEYLHHLAINIRYSGIFFA
jgi:hypothetical protein